MSQVERVLQVVVATEAARTQSKVMNGGKPDQKTARADDRQRSGHLQMQVSAEINKHKVSIDKAVFKKLPFERQNINRLKSQYKHDIKHSQRFHEDRNALLDHFMKQQMPNWGMLTFSLAV